ncbi:hypothetical protein DFQ26_006325, partial [Actinomortierella ambigua]
MPSAVILEQTPDDIKLHNAKLVKVPKPTPNPDEALVKIKAVALNHRDIWILDGNYP